MNKFDTIKVGDKAEISHKISQSDIAKFIDLTGDDNRLHHDAEYSKHTAFKKPVAHGMLGASFISTIIGTKLPGDGALWYAQNLEFLLPVRVDDVITVKAEVIKKNERDRSIELKTEVYNQNKQKVITGSAKVKLVEEEVSTTPNAPPRHSEKVALVIGGAGGIGGETCVQLAQKGFRVIVHYHSDHEKALKVQATVENFTKPALLIKADITDSAEVEEMSQQIARYFDHIDCLINCSSSKITSVPLKELQWEDFQKHMDVAIKGTFNLVQSLCPLLEKSGSGKIINLVSQAIETPNAQWLPYITAKSALSGMSKALAIELAPKNITVNLVSPGMTDTDLIADIPEKVRLLQAARTPLRRLAKPKDIASAIVFLASEETSFITGETLRINGGLVMI